MLQQKTLRQKAERKGKVAEVKAMLLLRLKGYKIYANRYRSPAGEIDIIAQRGSTLVFVEVKARISVDDALHAIAYKQRKRIEKAAEGWLRIHTPQYTALRFDVIAVPRLGLPKHVIDAWRPQY